MVTAVICLIPVIICHPRLVGQLKSAIPPNMEPNYKALSLLDYDKYQIHMLYMCERHFNGAGLYTEFKQYSNC